LVIQFQDLQRWGGYAGSGKVVHGLGREAVVSGTFSPQLSVLDTDRAAVIVFLASNPGPGALDALLDVGAHVYGVPREGVRLGS
jgi:hypothetical protein